VSSGLFAFCGTPQNCLKIEQNIAQFLSKNAKNTSYSIQNCLKYGTIVSRGSVGKTMPVNPATQRFGLLVQNFAILRHR
jgi:hypothetical protein